MLTLATARADSTAPPAAFFECWADVARRAEWDRALAWVRLDGPFREGSTGVYKPTRGPQIRFVIETLVPGREFTDVATLPGTRLAVRHRVGRRAGGGTEVKVDVSVSGPLALVWAAVLRRSVTASTTDGLRRLVEVVESAAT